MKLTFLGQKDSDNEGKKVNGKHTQTYLPTSPNNPEKQTTFSTGKKQNKTKTTIKFIFGQNQKHKRTAGKLK